MGFQDVRQGRSTHMVMRMVIMMREKVIAQRTILFSVSILMVNKIMVKNVFWFKHYKFDRENFFQDDSGTIEMAELVEIIGTLYEMEVVKLTSLKK